MGSEDGPNLPRPLPRVPINITNKGSANSSQSHESISVVSIAPVIAAIATLLVITFFLVSYYRVLSAWFIQRFAPGTDPSPGTNGSAEDAADRELEQQPVFFVRSNALSGSLVRRLPVHKKRKGSVSLETCNDCAVCLGEFQDGDDVKILPNCKHGFHVECIDTWLSSHSNICPLCRAKVEPVTGDTDTHVTGAAEVVRPGIARKRGSSMEEISVFKTLKRHLQRSSSTSTSLKEPLPRSTVQLEPTSSSDGSRIHLNRSFSWSRVLSIKRKRSDEQELQVYPEV